MIPSANNNSGSDRNHNHNLNLNSDERPLGNTPSSSTKGGVVTMADIRHLFEGVPERSLSRQYPWDNSGAQLLCHNNPITGISLCLDITPEVLSDAIERGNNLIISHHPLIFTPMKRISNTTPAGVILIDAIRNNINILSYHTNLDLADYSIADYILDKVGLPAGSIYEQVGVDKVYIKRGSDCFVGGTATNDDPPFDLVPYGLGRVVDLPTPMTIDEVVRLFADALALASGGFVHNLPEPTQAVDNLPEPTQAVGTTLPNGRTPLSTRTKFHRLAIIPGSGFASWEHSLACGVDLLVSGDLKHHQALDAKMAGVATLDIGHEGSETPYLHHIRGILAHGLGLDADVVEGRVMHR